MGFNYEWINVLDGEVIVKIEPAGHTSGIELPSGKIDIKRLLKDYKKIKEIYDKNDGDVDEEIERELIILDNYVTLLEKDDDDKNEN